MPLIRKTRAAILAGAALATLAVPITTAGAQSSAISASDRSEGAKANPQLIAEFGGTVSGPQAAYVETIGKNIAVQSGLSGARNDFTVNLLNSSIDNAFAIPGGYIYVTRQLVSLMNNEAELAGVLGHEVGHVAARHSAKRQSEATRNGILGAIGSILSTVLLGNSQIGQLLSQGIQQSTQLLTLKYSRGQETEADNLGISYLKRAGYDPHAMATVLRSLANQNALDARLLGSNNTVPEWASTHPDPASRVQAALRQAGNSTGITNRDTFLSRINGLVYGDDPKQGIVEGRMFTHPDLRMHFEAPSGYYLVNGTDAVSINGNSGKGQFSTMPFNGNLSSYIQSALNALTGGQQQLTASDIRTTTVNGIPAAYTTVRTQSGGSAVDVTVFAYQWSSTQAYHFVTITQAGQSNVFNSMFGSMRRISANEAVQIRPRKLSVVTATARDTVQTLAARMAYPNAQLDRFLVLNGLTSSSRIAAGQKVKIVTY
ncbi:M48 family metalloprotease [Parablastomonas sp. CN1-191]|uniref:M48 family metalloprotease n=1 Tax=Parablastomonas sp. CN1-191 TaxID=3400908 RepID=UPI003BF8CE09